MISVGLLVWEWKRRSCEVPVTGRAPKANGARRRSARHVVLRWPSGTLPISGLRYDATLNTAGLQGPQRKHPHSGHWTLVMARPDSLKHRPSHFPSSRQSCQRNLCMEQQVTFIKPRSKIVYASRTPTMCSGTSRQISSNSHNMS